MKKLVLLSSLLLLVPASALAGDDKDEKTEKTETDKAAATGEGADTIAQKSNAPPESKDPEEGKMTDVREKDGKHYYFIGFRYRGTVVPQFLMNLFVDGGRTVYNSAAGVELDIRKDNFSIIPSIMLMEHSMERTPFLEKGKDANLAGNWTVVGADIKGLYGAVDLVWSAPFAKNFAFDFGFGVGIGVTIGDISNNWVYGGRGAPSPQYPITTKVNGVDYSFAPCTTTTTDSMEPAMRQGCRAINHNNSTVDKVGATYNATTGKVEGGYTERGWTSGGSVPSIFPYLSLPILGLRIKPIKALEMRTQIGFSITGFYFQLSASYGVERPTR